MTPTDTLPPPDPSKCSYYQGFFDALGLDYDALKHASSTSLNGPAYAYRRAFLDAIDAYREPFDAQYRTLVNPPDRAP